MALVLTPSRFDVLLTENLFGDILSCGLPRPAAAIERAVQKVLGEGLRTVDLAASGTAPVGCSAFAKAVAESVRELVPG